MANVFENILNKVPDLITAKAEFAAITVTRRERAQRGGRTFANDIRFDKRQTPCFFVEDGNEQDVQLVFGNPGLVWRKYQVFVLGAFSNDDLATLNLNNVREVKDLLRSVLRCRPSPGVVSMPGVSEVWHVEIPSQANYDMSNFDPDFKWCCVEVWYHSKEEAV